jgi:hypothetical protein
VLTEPEADRIVEALRRVLETTSAAGEAVATTTAA